MDLYYGFFFFEELVGAIVPPKCAFTVLHEFGTYEV